MAKGVSLFSKYPDYKVELETIPSLVRVTFNGEVVAESEAALLIRESRHDPVIYFPRQDIRFASKTREAVNHSCLCYSHQPGCFQTAWNRARVLSA
jgi:uncharacterized protein (DUF427 family)